MTSSQTTSDLYGVTPSASRISLSSRLTTGTAASTLYRSTLESSGYQNETFHDRLEQTRRWIYDSDIGLVMGRSPWDWAKYLLAWVLSLITLLGLFVGMMAVLWATINWNQPDMQGTNSILQTPGMSFRPQPDAMSTLIRFRRGCFYNSCPAYLDHMEAYIQYYEKNRQVGERFTNCENLPSRRSELDKACEFDLDDLGGVCVKQINYGFNDGQPCVILKLNKVFDWVPEEYQSIEEVPDAIKDVWSPDDPYWIHVACEGEDPATKELLGPVTVTPKGFHFKYFPFRNQEGYRSPLVMVQFLSPTIGVMMLVTCRAYARNIVHDRHAMTGQVHLEILVD